MYAQEHDTITTIEDQEGTPWWERERLSNQWEENEEGRGRGEREWNKTTPNINPGTRPPANTNTWTVLPGITEIVFKALRTLNVRRADTLPRFTNSVIYLQGGSRYSYSAAIPNRGKKEQIVTWYINEHWHHDVDWRRCRPLSIEPFYHLTSLKSWM